MKLRVLRNKTVEVITSKEMSQRFGKNLTCAKKGETLYVSMKAFMEEKLKFGDYLSDEEIAEDFYRETRMTETEKHYHIRYTMWDKINKARCPSKLFIEFNEKVPHS